MITDLTQAKAALKDSRYATNNDDGLFYLKLTVGHLIDAMERKTCEPQEPRHPMDPDASESPQEPSSDPLKHILGVALDKLAKELKKA